jgi:hypothetical protein
LKAALAGDLADLVEVAGASEKAEVVRLEASFAAGLLRVGMEEKVVVSDWPVSPGERTDVLLTRRDVYAPGAEIWVASPAGLRRTSRSALVFFWGEAAGDADVRVMVSVDPATRELNGFSVTATGTHDLQPVPKSWHAGARYVVGPRDLFLDARGAAAAGAWKCGEEDLPAPLGFLDAAVRPVRDEALAPEWTKAGISALHTATLAVDTDNELMHLKFANNATSATNYIASLIAAMNVMYERDLLVRLVQGFTILRPSPGGNPTDYTTDPYSQSCISSGSPSCAANVAQLDEISTYWAGGCGGACGAVSRALTMMLSGKQTSNNSASGIAWRNTLCSTGTGYSFSQVFKFSGSTGAHDSRLVGHELGHNFGSRHTHCYSPPLDNCYNLEGGCYSGGTSCPAAATYNGVANVRGTVMSYCHVLGGCSASEVFHPVTVDLLDDIILSHASGGNACIVPFAPPGPTVTSAAPASGLTTGGTSVTLTGTNFVNGATVAFGTSPSAVLATGVVVVNATTLTVVAPAHATGAVRVTVTNPNAQSGLKDSAYFYAPPATASGFFTLTPCRVIDTRNAAGARGGPSLAANAVRLFTVTGVCGVPANAKAISVNATVVAGAGSGSFTFYPGNAFPLGTNNLNFPSGANRAGASILTLATDGTGTIGSQNFSGVANHLILDVNGYFQ